MKLPIKLYARWIWLLESKNWEAFYLLRRRSGNLTLRYWKETIWRPVTLNNKIKPEDKEIAICFIKYLVNVSELFDKNVFDKVMNFQEYKKKYIESNKYCEDLKNLFLPK